METFPFGAMGDGTGSVPGKNGSEDLADARSDLVRCAAVASIFRAKDLALRLCEESQVDGHEMEEVVAAVTLRAAELRVAVGHRPVPFQPRQVGRVLVLVCDLPEFSCSLHVLDPFLLL